MPDAFFLGRGPVVFTYQGRNAIYLLCQLLEIGNGDEVLMPSYNCGAEVDPFLRVGARVIFYRVNEKTEIDLEDIISRVTHSTKLIYVTHSFGWPQETAELAGFCKERGLALVEDCAQSLFSRGPRNTIGRVGDAAIYSLVKSLPVPDGGALVLNNSAIKSDRRMLRPPKSGKVFVHSLPLAKKWLAHESQLLQRFGLAPQFLGKSWRKRLTEHGQAEAGRCELPKSNYFDAQRADWSMSRLAMGILSRQNPETIIRMRRQNYEYLDNALRKIPFIQPLFDQLLDGVCPLAFPIISRNRNRWRSLLENKGIPTGGWPSYHRDFDWGAFPAARYLKDSILTLPVNQGLDERHVEYIIQCVKSIAEEDDNRNGR